MDSSYSNESISHSSEDESSDDDSIDMTKKSTKNTSKS